MYLWRVWFNDCWFLRWQHSWDFSFHSDAFAIKFWLLKKKKSVSKRMNDGFKSLLETPEYVISQQII